MKASALAKSNSISGAHPSVVAYEGLVRPCVASVFVLFLVFEVLGGLLRHYLHLFGLDVAVYLPKFAMVVLAMFLPILRGRVHPYFLCAAAVLLAGAAVGAAQFHSGPQALFGLWVLVPFLFGLSISAIFGSLLVSLRSLMLAFFWIAWLGLVASFLFAFPWVGASYDVMGVSIQTSRDWNTFGIFRMPGFSRASYSVASQILILGLLLTILPAARAMRILIWLMAGSGILLTTSKGPMVAWLVLSLYLLTATRFSHSSWNTILTLIAIVSVALPLSTLYVVYDYQFDSLYGEVLLASFTERLTWMWPDSLGLLYEWQWLVGRGIGGIGVPQQYFEREFYLAADNMFVYLCVDLGLIGATLVLCWIVRTALRLNMEIPDNGRSLWFAVILAIVTYGAVTNIVESPELTFFLGVALGVRFQDDKDGNFSPLPKLAGQ